METLRSLLTLGFVFFICVILPIGLLVLFVNARAKARRAMLEGPWSAVAAQYGGRLVGERVLVTRDIYQMTLGMELVSVMQAVGSPYYSDGGTFTDARLSFDPKANLQIVPLDRPWRLTSSQVAMVFAGNPLAQLPAGSRVVLSAHEARVVLAGAVADSNVLGAAFAGLQSLAERVRVLGSMQVPA